MTTSVSFGETSKRNESRVKNIVYLDFDGTITGAHGREVISSPLCEALSNKATFDERMCHKNEYDASDNKVKITENAKKFLQDVNKLHPQVKIVIISRNHENYIKALLEFENIDHRNITIYPRGVGNKIGPGEDKYKAVVSHEKKPECLPGFRLICDDDEIDGEEMYNGLKHTGRSQLVKYHNEKPGQFKWGEYFKEILTNCDIAIKEYLNGKIGSRFHLFTAKVDEKIGDQAFKDRYSQVKGDILKRAIINNLKNDIEKIDNLDDLKDFIKKFKQSSEYMTLSKAQGLFTKVTGIKTDSQRAVEEIFSKALKDLQSPKLAMR
ncbi:Dot/Icm T4SS effector Lem4/SmdA [Legionella pneumophila]|uniref:Dot/Icm T4SS effector Lem4/SmdA n=1 Tax=Legionella pneumophila TaxID=446 RepID=UPI0007708211|nr:Dot/Icm T4SS effector Lem4/SmdA [Legionella pneumophila]CZG25222.1 Uncharacterised protein [Legionella pneumophila]HAT1980393.1 Dot/Icm T4SS effector Lem4/SmdA [Legionella pneumophila]HAT4422715.1 Dot/Icm T4SS effector Lem4/SmdA [Legionella pneumophila]HAU1719457.1 Dot/Icm T4SS effector Lem4/SmdA [Legionella pneumophila]HBB7078172.1 Dot/Icm T4SS effector Lem4/SmdA [Legionella pneumophila]